MSGRRVPALLQRSVGVRAPAERRQRLRPEPGAGRMSGWRVPALLRRPVGVRGSADRHRLRPEPGARRMSGWRVPAVQRRSVGVRGSADLWHRLRPEPGAGRVPGRRIPTVQRRSVGVRPDPELRSRRPGLPVQWNRLLQRKLRFQHQQLRKLKLTLRSVLHQDCTRTGPAKEVRVAQGARGGAFFTDAWPIQPGFRPSPRPSPSSGLRPVGSPRTCAVAPPSTSR